MIAVHYVAHVDDLRIRLIEAHAGAYCILIDCDLVSGLKPESTSFAKAFAAIDHHTSDLEYAKSVFEQTVEMAIRRKRFTNSPARKSA